MAENLLDPGLRANKLKPAALPRPTAVSRRDHDAMGVERAN
jgi:hypothetical protein